MKSKLTREEQAKIEIGHTDIAKITSRVLVIAFLCLTGFVPVIQGIYELHTYISGKDKSFLPSFLKMYSVAGNTIKEFSGSRKDIISNIIDKKLTSMN